MPSSFFFFFFLLLRQSASETSLLCFGKLFILLKVRLRNEGSALNIVDTVCSTNVMYAFRQVPKSVAKLNTLDVMFIAVVAGLKM